MKEYSLCILKPDSIERNLERFIFNKIESSGLTLHNRVEKIFTLDEVQIIYFESIKQPYYQKIVDYMTSGLSAYYLVRGNDAIKRLNDLVGDTNPLKAVEGSIRQLIGQSILVNSIHSSNENRVDDEIVALYRVSDLEGFLLNS